jgi:alanine dehydrogenase
MDIGVPKEIKQQEHRVALNAAGVKKLIAHGHRVFVETNAGIGAGISDEEYKKSGAIILANASNVYAQSTMIVKVKEPLESEYRFLTSKHILFTYLHLAASMPLTRALIQSNCIALAYESVELTDKSLPLLIPMSEIAGKMSVQVGARFLEKSQGGSGVLLGGVPGVMAGNLLILGAGIVGKNAAQIAAGMGANVFIADINTARLRYLSEIMPANVKTIYSSESNIEGLLPYVDLLVGAVLVPGGKAPTIIQHNHIAMMKKGSVIVDVAVDQGGCVASSKVTSHENPVFVYQDVLHYGVPNMPGAVPQTATQALTSATLPYICEIANKGWEHACKSNYALQKALNIARGDILLNPVKELFEQSKL